MQSLTSTNIDTIVKHLRDYAISLKLKTCSIALTKKGNPWCIPGGQCRVYKVTLQDGSVKALRFWQDIMSNVEIRCKAISRYIQATPASYLLSFEYIPNAFSFNHQIYPVVLMDWCPFGNLKQYVAKNLSNATNLKRLQTSFLNLIKDMHSRMISHGDLHHDNIRVDNSGRLVLIDYDSFFVPALNGLSDDCKGYSGYQHPSARANNKFLSSKIDYFSELVIYLSIELLIANPHLWIEAKIEEQDYSFIFTHSDFTRLLECDIYKKTYNLNNQIRDLYDILAIYLNNKDITKLEPFYKYVKSFSNLTTDIFCMYCGTKRYSSEDVYCCECGLKYIYIEMDRLSTFQSSHYTENLQLFVMGFILKIIRRPVDSIFDEILLEICTADGKSIYSNVIKRNIETVALKIPDGLFYLNIYTHSRHSSLYYAYLHNNVLIESQGGILYFHNPKFFRANKDFIENIDTTKTAILRYTKPSYAIQSYDSQIKSVAKNITRFSHNDYHRLLCIHNWISKNLCYNYDVLSDDKYKAMEFNAYEAMSTKNTICQGYTQLAIAMARSLNIPSIGITSHTLNAPEAFSNLISVTTISNESDHIFSAAWIDNRWVLFDTTWDSTNQTRNDESIDEEKDCYSLKYFDTTYQLISSTHKFVDIYI